MFISILYCKVCNFWAETKLIKLYFSYILWAISVICITSIFEIGSTHGLLCLARLPLQPINNFACSVWQDFSHMYCTQLSHMPGPNTSASERCTLRFLKTVRFWSRPHYHIHWKFLLQCQVSPKNLSPTASSCCLFWKAKASTDIRGYKHFKLYASIENLKSRH